MKRITTISILAAIMLLSVSLGFALEHTIGLRGGTAIPFVDRDEESKLKIMGGLSYDLWLKNDLALGLRPYYANIEGEDMTSSYNTDLIGGDVVLKYRPTRKLALNFRDSFLKRISPYGELGFGMVNFEDGNGKSRMALTAPAVGLGVSFQTKWKVNLDLGAQYNYAHNDNLDGLKANDFQDSYLMPYLGLGFTFGKSKDGDQESKIVPFVARPILRNRISMEENFTLQGVQFEIGSANLTADAQKTLDEVAEAMKAAPMVKVEIHGHTDNTGSLELNNRLSLQRAESVKKYLVGKGVEESRLGTKGFGPSKPIATNDTPEGRTENRRIEFVIVK